MHNFTPTEIDIIKQNFLQLKVDNSNDWDWFFAQISSKLQNNILQPTINSYERLKDYQEWLTLLIELDRKKYYEIHKWTPFYFIAWFSFDLGYHEKAVFYMDAAISEDIRAGWDWINLPAGKFMTLASWGSADRITQTLRNKISEELLKFNPSLNIDFFIEKFVKKLLEENNENCSTITAFYSYILEFEDRKNELELRSIRGGSIEPVLIFLFKGGLIFESILKNKYPYKGTKKYSTLKNYFETEGFKADFKCNITISSSSIEDILKNIDWKKDEITAFETTSRLRNITGHNLALEDKFTVSNFQKLYEQQLNAIFYLI